MSKMMNKKGFSEVETIDEIIFNALQPKKATNQTSSVIYNIKKLVEEKIEKEGGNKNWAVFEVSLDWPEIDFDYQRELKNSEVARITNNFDLNRVEIKVASIRKVDGKWHLYLVDGAHTLSALLYMRSKGFNVNSMFCKVFVNLTKQEEASLFASQNIGKTNIRGFERYKAELCAQYPNALVIDKVTKEFGLTIKTNYSDTTINRYKNINAIEELYRIVRKEGENGLRYVFQLIQNLNWEGDTMSYTQRMLGGLAKVYTAFKGSPEKLAMVEIGLKSFSTSNEFFKAAVKNGYGDHYSDLVGSYAMSFAK